MPEFYFLKYNTRFGLIDDELYELDEDENEWEPVDWDIIAEDDGLLQDYRWIHRQLLDQLT